MHLSEIHIYPVKGLAGIALTESVVEKRGLQHDRRWMLTDADGKFVSQREIPGMALIGTAIASGQLILFSRTRPQEQIGIPLQSGTDRLDQEVEVWGDRFMAQQASAMAGEWLSDQLGHQLKLAYMPDNSVRPADPRYAPEGHVVSFADGFPFLIIGQSALDHLNEKLANPIPMNRFRPNFVFTGGGEPHEEDHWREFQIGDQLFCGVKPCARCQVTTIHQDTTERGAEPLKTLSTYRFSNNKILFGQNVIWLGNGGTVKIGDPITFPA